MQNYSAVFAATLEEFQSPIVPASQADAGKGQLTTRAGLKINATNSTIGFIKKTPGQVQHAGVGVDVLLSSADGSWDDYVTDLEVPGDLSLRRIAIAYTPHGPAGAPPYAAWVQPTLAHVNTPGPMTLKSDVGPGPDPGPGPGPDDDVIITMLDELTQMLVTQAETLADMRAQQAADTARIIQRDNDNTQKIQEQLHDIVEDMEETLKQALVLILASRASESGGISGIIRPDPEELANDVMAAARERRQARR